MANAHADGAMEGNVATRQRKREYVFPLLSICALGAAVRIYVAYHGGIWADEGFFLLVANAPSWGAMIDFLKLHESHPPLFYSIMRVWISIAGTGDVAELMLPVALGIAIIPAIFVVGCKLFSKRAGLIAAGLAAISPALIEFSGQLRPYGLLPLLTLISCYALVAATERGGGARWTAYVTSALALVYTHNWSWLVVGGQFAAVGWFLLVPARAQKSKWRDAALAWMIFFVAFVPWLNALMFQFRHAGHVAIVENWKQFIEFVALSVPATGVMLLFGALPVSGKAVLITALVAAISGAILLGIAGYRSFVGIELQSGDNYAVGGPVVRATMLLIVPVVAILLLLCLAPRTNLLLPRCIAMMTPLILLLIARVVDQGLMRGAATRQSVFTVGIAAAIVAVSGLADLALVQSKRSNVREVASNLARAVRPSDLIIMVPEWYAASFGHYFMKPIEEIDYPNPGRGGMVDFAHVFERVSDDRPIALLGERIRLAKAEGRRVWLITARNYLRRLSPLELAHAKKYRQSPIISIHRAGQIRDSLRLLFGEPDTSLFLRDGTLRYEEVLPFLYKASSASNPGLSSKR